MTKSISTAALAATTSILMTTTAIAEVTAQQVWEDWSSYMQATGYSLSVTSQTTLGNITTLSGVVASQTLSANAKDIATVAIDYGTVTLTEADGKVIIGFDNNMQVTSSSLENSDEFNLTANIGTPGMSLIASGDDITTQYEFDVPELRKPSTITASI